MQIRKICIKSIAVLMAVIVMVSTPLSRFADTKGVSESHAVAPTLITLGGLFGAIAGAYGLYVAADKLGDMAEGWFNWTADNAVDARTDLQKIKDGVTSYVVSKVVMESVADYLATQEGSSVSVSSKNVIIEPKNTLPATSFSSSFDVWFNSSDHSSDYFCISWAPSATYGSGIYHVYHYYSIPDMLARLETFDEYKKYMYVFYPYKGDVSKHVGYYYVYGTDGLPLVCDKMHNSVPNNYLSCNSYAYVGAEWKIISSSSNVLFKKDFFINTPLKTRFPVVVTDMTNVSNLSYEQLMNGYNSYDYVLDYNTHGNNALDNSNALEGAELTEAQLQAIHQAVEEEYSNVIQFPNSGGDNEEDDKPSNLDNAMFTALIANAVAQAVANTLKDMGYIKNPTDEPSGENVKEQLGNIQISLDGLIDAISQINPAQGLANIAQGIAELPQKITASVTDAIRNVFDDLFVPDEGAIQDKVDEITDKFAFADSLLTVVDDIDGALKNASGPPEIYIHFEDAEDSKYTPIGTLKLLSFEWYERYKPYGDALLSSMLWLFFLWKVRKRIAEIVQGLSVSGESDANASSNSAIGIERGRSS